MAYLLSQIIDDTANRMPGQHAFRFLDKALSYASLAESSNRLAWLLVERGVKRGDRVGILLHKSLESPIALFGIMKAGAAYVPLDPGVPAHRLRETIRQCGIRHLVGHAQTRERVLELLSAPSGLEFVVGIDDLGAQGAHTVSWNALETMPAERAPEVGLMEQDLGYIMYTSGSTGRPKGIMHTHASGLSYARMSAEMYGIDSGDRLSNHSPLHFDMSTLDYFTGPLTGATTIIIPEAYTKLPASLTRLIAEECVTIWYSVPYALLQALTRGAIEQHDMGALRWVLFGGEPFPTKHLNALRRLWPHARFGNVYGPAEVNQCTYYNLPAEVGADEDQVPIGRVWPNAEGLIVDEEDRSVEPGEVGELLIRAPTMMRGYWEQPELNAGAFYYRPVSGDISDRFYRTGDLVQERADGEMLFLGRKDRQIKTRGFRVELDEIEHALTTHPAVAESAVYTVCEDDGSLRIEAAVIQRRDQAVDAGSLRTYCAERLPPYALPQVFLDMSVFPRTTSGKIDRRALRESSMNSQPEDVAL